MRRGHQIKRPANGFRNRTLMGHWNQLLEIDFWTCHNFRFSLNQLVGRFFRFQSIRRHSWCLNEVPALQRCNIISQPFMNTDYFNQEILNEK